MDILHLKITTLYSQLIVLSTEHPHLQELWDYLNESLSYEVQNSFFIKQTSKKAFVRDYWDGRVRLFNVKSGKFLTGFLPYVKDALKVYDIPYSEEDIRPVYTKQKVGELVDIEPREYQIEALNTLLQNKRGILWASPRAGKTLVSIMLYHELGLTPFLSICQSLDIAYQTKLKFEKFLPEVKVGIIGDGEIDIQDITIATIQSITSAYDKQYDVKKNEKKERPIKVEEKQKVRDLIEHAKIVWADECHHCTSSTWKFILENKVFSAEYVIGCSGTPYREDNTGKLLEGLIGPIIYEIGYSTLIKHGFLVPPTIHLIKIPKDSNVVEKFYATVYKEGIVENKLRNDIIKRIAENLNKRGKSCMILVSKLNHGNILQDLITDSIFLHGTSTNREEVWEDLRNKKLLTLITTLGDEGVDLPSLDATIIAAGGESAIKVFQRLRCLTPYKQDGYEKKHSIIVDFIDSNKYLKTHSNKRKKLYLSEPSFKVVIRKGQ